MRAKKTRKGSGWVTPRSTIKAKPKELINDCLEPQPFFDEWNTNRDSQKGWNDRTKIKPPLYEQFNSEHWNKKNKKKLKIRKAKKTED